MKTLSFRKHAIEPILTGSQRSTVRSKTRLQAGELAAARCLRKGPPFAILEVTGLGVVRLADLDPDAAETRRLKKLYPDAEDLVEITFRALPPSDPGSAVGLPADESGGAEDQENGEHRHHHPEVQRRPEEDDPAVLGPSGIDDVAEQIDGVAHR